LTNGIKKNMPTMMIFPENIGEYLSIDEVSLSQGELYTFVTNKKGKGKEGTLVASIKGTTSNQIIEVLKKLPEDKRKLVMEVTLDMAKNMESATKKMFPNCRCVTDRFHVVKLSEDALQHIRIKHRWEALDIENKAIDEAKKCNIDYEPKVYENDDTPKQLLARCRYVLAKKEEDWTENQKQRAEILFREFPKMKQVYHHTLEFRSIYEETKMEQAKQRFLDWAEKTYTNEYKEFYTVANTLKNNLDNILNFFTNRNTNANAESFNAKIKLFRANLRGVVDPKFFLFRLHKLFA